MAKANTKATGRKNVHTAKKSYASPFSIYWVRENYIFIFAAIGVIFLGYYLMSVGNWNSSVSLNLSPLFLAVGYFILLPIAIFYRKRRTVKVQEEQNVPGQS